MAVTDGKEKQEEALDMCIMGLRLVIQGLLFKTKPIIKYIHIYNVYM